MAEMASVVWVWRLALAVSYWTRLTVRKRMCQAIKVREQEQLRRVHHVRVAINAPIDRSHGSHSTAISSGGLRTQGRTRMAVTSSRSLGAWLMRRQRWSGRMVGGRPQRIPQKALLMPLRMLMRKILGGGTRDLPGVGLDVQPRDEQLDHCCS